MFTPYQHSVNMSWPRPFVVGFILLMVFLSMSGDSPSNLTTSGLTDSAAAADTQENEKGVANKGIKEQIIYDLSLSNEKLEQEIKKYRQYVLDIRRAVRAQPGCSLEDSSILTLYPELRDDIDDGFEKDNEEKGGESDSDKSSKEAAALGRTVVAKEEKQNEVDDGIKKDGSKDVDSASIRLQNGRLSKENNTVSTRTNLP